MTITEMIIEEANDWKESVIDVDESDRLIGALEALRYLSDRLCDDGTITADHRDEIWTATEYITK